MMTRLIRSLLIVIAILGLTGFRFFLPRGVQRDSSQQYRQPEEEREKADRSDPAPPGALEAAWRASMESVAPAVPTTAADHWTSIGPGPINGGQFAPAGAVTNTGRIVDIAVDPNDELNHWFIAAHTGGIWETKDGGNNWAPKTDGEASLAMGTITIAPSNPQILFATNSTLLKSINGGASWTKLPNIGENLSFAAVRVDPADPNIVVAMTSAGISRSVDGGVTFCTTLAGGGTALHATRANFNKQYAALNRTSANYNGIRRSVDGGQSWSVVTGPWTQIANNGEAVKIAISPSDSQTIYVVVPSVGIWKTQDGWAQSVNWTALANVPAALSGFWGTLATVVDPVEPNIFYAGGYGDDLFRYNPDKTPQWRSIRDTHRDQWVLATVRLSETDGMLLLGNDGGFWTSTNNGELWTSMNTNLATVQFYFGSVHPTNPTAALGGSQDNGTESWNGTAWDLVFGGDGCCTAFSYTNPDNVWLVQASFPNGPWIFKYVVGGGVTYAGPLDPTEVGTARVRRAPDSNVLLAGAAKLWKSTDFFTATPPVWTNNGPNAMDSSGVSAVAFAAPPHASSTYAFGTGNGAVWLTTSGGAGKLPWKDLTQGVALLPDRVVNSIAFDPSNRDILYVALGGWDTVTPAGHIFKATNATTVPTWTDVTPRFLNQIGGTERVDIPMNALAIDPAHPNIIYAGADIGVWKSTTGGGNGVAGDWTFMGPGSGMPNVGVRDLHFSPVPDGKLVAFTWGRSAFRLNTGVPDTGLLQVNLTPGTAVSAGAQWRVDWGPFQNSGTTLSGISSGVHTVSFKPVNGYVTPADQLVEVNPVVSTTSRGVYSTPPPRLANISTRLSVGTGENVLIGGFIVTGPSSSCVTKHVALRGLGPSLPSGGNNLEDPYLELHGPTGALIAENDDWKEDPNLPGYLRPSDPRESVILASLAPGTYTVILHGVNNGTGIGVFDAYDLDSTSPLVWTNISTRGFVQTGNDVMIGGCILTGSSARIVFRGLGPSLPVGQGQLQDPFLELYGPNGLIAVNDNWTAGPNLPPVLHPGHPSESVIVATLAPGAYTVILRGVNNGTGVGLFDAYPLDY